MLAKHLEVRLYSAQNLSFQHPLGYYDPSCALSLSARTTTISPPRAFAPIRKATSPAWNQMITFEVDDPWSDMLQVQVFDTNDDQEKILLGSCVVPLIGLQRNRESLNWYALNTTINGSLSSTGAEIQLGLKPLDFDPPELIAQYQSPQSSPLPDLSKSAKIPALPPASGGPLSLSGGPLSQSQPAPAQPYTSPPLVLTPSLQFPQSISQVTPTGLSLLQLTPPLQTPSVTPTSVDLTPSQAVTPQPPAYSQPLTLTPQLNGTPSHQYQLQLPAQPTSYQSPITPSPAVPQASPVALTPVLHAPVQHSPGSVLQPPLIPNNSPQGHSPHQAVSSPVHQPSAPTHHQPAVSQPAAPQSNQLSPNQIKGQSPVQDLSPNPSRLVPLPAIATQMPSPHQPPRTGLINFHPSDLKRDFPHIAKGSFGVVFKGTAKGFSQIIVIKDLEIQNQKSVDEWRKEITLMTTVRSPYIVPVYGFCSDMNNLTIVMEYMANGDLYQILHKKAAQHPLSLLQRMRMARHCAGGLACLHSNRIIHRDVKSMNILVSEDYSAKLTDFGCSKLVPNESRMFHTANSGSPLWMAPEVKRGQYSFSADMYSLGLVLYELFERKLPQYDQNRQTVILPPNFQSCTVVMPCLNPIANQRPPAQKVVSVLDKMINHLVVSVRVMLPQHEQDMFKEETERKGIGGSDVDMELMQLYRYLLQKPPGEVDALISRVFNIETDKPPPKQGIGLQPRYAPPSAVGPSVPPAYIPNVAPNYGRGPVSHGYPNPTPNKVNNGFHHKVDSESTPYLSQLQQLEDMGFNRDLTLPLLKKYDGNVERVTDYLIGA